MSELYVDSTLYVGRPADESGRSARETGVYDLLDTLGVTYCRVDHSAVDTIADCAVIEKCLGAPICKNLFLRNRQGTAHYLLLMQGRKPFRTATVSRLLGVSRLSFGGPDELLDCLELTPGSVSILALAKDPEHRVQLLIDRDVLAGDDIGCHPCKNTSSLRIRTQDILEKFLPFTGHVPLVLDIPDESTQNLPL